MDKCPVHIHKVTEGTTPEVNGNISPVGVCPVAHQNGKEAPHEPNDVTLVDIDVDSISETPSLKEFKKLRNVMSMITKFYEDGSQRKKENYETMVGEIKKLEEDQRMCEEQLASLESKSYFKSHPKAKEYRTNLQDELEGLLKQKKVLEDKRDEFYQLYEWSKTIVEVCEWLEANFEDYCRNNIPDLPAHLFKKEKPPELTEEQKKAYSKGLAEITYNLQESQDFFQASVDGRLLKYHNIEKEIIEAQLEVIRKYREDSPRRMHIESELEKDLEYVQGHMEETPESKQRKLKMLKNHQEFFKVLRYHKDKLKALGVDTEERVYDPKFDHYH